MRDPRYPPDWNAIALAKKLSVNWRCEKCGLKCIDPAFKSDMLLSERSRRKLQVHHSDYDPSNNSGVAESSYELVRNRYFFKFQIMN